MQQEYTTGSKYATGYNRASKRHQVKALSAIRLKVVSTGQTCKITKAQSM
jgi:hypothetical protein